MEDGTELTNQEQTGKTQPMQTRQRPRNVDLRHDAPLRIELFSLCEAAFEKEGRLTVLRSFEAIRTPGLPTALPKAAAVARARLLPTEVEKIGFHLRLVDPDGHAVLASAQGDVTPVPFDEDRACAYNLIFQLSGVTFTTRGEHRLEFYLGGELEAQLPLHVLGC